MSTAFRPLEFLRASKLNAALVEASQAGVQAATSAGAAAGDAAVDARLLGWNFTADGASNRTTGTVQAETFSLINTGRGLGGSFRLQGFATVDDRVSWMTSAYGPFPISMVSHKDAAVALNPDGTITPVPVGINHVIFSHAFKVTLNSAGAQSVSGYMKVSTTESPAANGGTGAGARWELMMTPNGAILPVGVTFRVDHDTGISYKGNVIVNAAGDLVGAGQPVSYITNPALLHWQAGTSFPVLTTATFLADRYKAARSVVGATYSRQAGFSGAQFCMRMQRNAADASTSALLLFQHWPTEKARQLAGKTLFVSFDAQAGANYSGSTLVASFYSGTAGGETLLMIGGGAGFATGGVTGGNINMGTPTTTAARMTHVVGYLVPADARDLAVRIFWTPTGTAGAADYVDITNIRVAEAGAAMTPYDLISDEMECRDYYRAVTWRFNALTAGATTQRSAIVFETPMRSTPTVTLTGQVQDITAAAACTASATANASAAGCTLSCTGNAATAVGNLLEIPVTFDARLT